MNRIQILVVVGLLAALAGTGAVYQFYVKARIAELSTHEAAAAELERTITKMETTFEKTVPDIMISGYRQQAQPWEDAVDRRTGYFPAPETEAAIAVPKEVIPKFYYREQFPEMQRKLELEAWEKGVVLPQQLTFGAPDPVAMSEKNPTAELVSDWLTQYNVGATMVRTLLEANAKSVDDIKIWPSRTNESVSGGFVIHTTGYEFTMGMRDLTRFLDKLRNETRHYTIEGFWMYNRQLRDTASDVVKVQLILSKTSFQRPQNAAPGSQLDGAKFDVSPSRVNSGLAAFTNPGGKSIFAARVDQGEAANSGGFVKWMLNFFPF